MRNRRGFSLMELMVALALMLIVTGAIYTLLTTTQRLSRAQSERAGLQSNVRAGLLVVPNELRELSTVLSGTAAQNDILSPSATGIIYRAIRGIGFLCQSPTTGSQLRMLRGSFSGYRDPAGMRDSAYVFLDGDPGSSADDAWLPVQVVNVATGTACPSGAQGITLTTEDKPEIVGLPIDTPVRIYEVMELKLYQSGGKSWLGARSVSAGEAIQPALGPLTDGNGLGLEYLDGAGAVTADRTAIKGIGVTVRGISEHAINAAGSDGPITLLGDSLSALVSLRNAFRP